MSNPVAVEGPPTDRAPRVPGRLARVWSWWPRVATWGALVWSLGYTIAGVAWWTGVEWYPFRKVPLDRASMSLLEGAPSSAVGPAFLAFGLLGVAAAVVLLLPQPSRRLHRAALVVGASWAVAATSLIPDYTILALLALWPVLVFFAFSGIQGGSQDGIGDILYWHRVNLILVFVGGLLWSGATLAARRRAAGGCVHCGRPLRGPSGVSAAQRERLLVLGRRFVWVAVLATLPYDVTRIAWYLGWPLGLTDRLYDSLQDPPELLAVGLALGLLSTAGAALTHGLVARWGEEFPRSIPGLGGRPVPVMMAVVPASVVAISLPPASIMFASPGLNGGFDMANWGVWLPSMFWLLWAIGLGGAAWTYYQRRRGACRHCRQA